MKNFWENEMAVAPVIGTVLLVGMTVIMISAVAVSVFAFSVPESAPQAKIVIAEAKGTTESAGWWPYDANSIVLKHKGGDAIFRNDTKIIISGTGLTYTGYSPLGAAQNIRVTYRGLSGNNYNWSGSNLGEIVKGVTWDAGETITLYGTDGTAPQGNAVDSKWVLNAGSEVRVTIIDLSTNEAIATSTITVD